MFGIPSCLFLFVFFLKFVFESVHRDFGGIAESCLGVFVVDVVVVGTEEKQSNSSERGVALRRHQPWTQEIGEVT